MAADTPQIRPAPTFEPAGITRDIAVELESLVPAGSKTLLKQIDEYNYAKYTKKWI